MMHPTATEKAHIIAASLQLGARPDDLANLIRFESNFNPKASNPLSSAKGLIQFTNATAQSLGYADSQDLITTNPTFAGQMRNAVIPYLARYAPFPTQQSLYMSVFYPAARSWRPDTVFPASVQRVNPGIVTVSDYIRKVNSSKLQPIILPTSILLIALLIWIFTKEDRKNAEATEDTQTAD